MTTTFKRVMSGFLTSTIMASLVVACTNTGADTAQPSVKPAETAPVNKDAAATAADGPLSLKADNEIIEKELAKVVTPDEFKNSQTFEYVFATERTPEPNSYGQRFFEKKFNVKLKHVGLGQENRLEKLNMMFATGTTPDLVYLNTLGQLQEFSKQGLLAEIPLERAKKNMPGYFKIVEENSPKLLKLTDIDGKNMGIVRRSASSAPLPANIRADWLKNVGINKVPATLDELETAFTKFRNEDPDKNGKKDTYALSNGSNNPGEQWFHSIFGAFGTNPFIWVDRGGKLQFGLTTPETKDALKLLNKWYKNQLIDPEFITDKGYSPQSGDVVTKFATGKLGYMDNVGSSEVQWDNDAQLNFRWVANHPEWKKFFEDNKNDPKKVYGTKVITDFNDSLPQPIYITMPGVKGPNGQQGGYQAGDFWGELAFGKQLEKDPAKFDKLLRILEYLNQDENTIINLGWGPNGINFNDINGELIFNPDFTKHAIFDSYYGKLGINYHHNPMYQTNPKLVGIVGGPRSTQRFDYTLATVQKFPAYENLLKGALPSQGKYTELVDANVKEYVIKAIAGDVDIDKTFDAMVKKWYTDGGEQLTKEANDWYVKFK